MSDLPVLVVGGSKGIGRAIAEKFLSQGKKVGISFNRTQPDWLQEWPQEQTFAHSCDVQSEESIKEFWAAYKEWSGKQCGILVYNAGITIDNLTISSKTEEFDQVMDTNLRGAWIFLREVGHLMFYRRKGRMFFISSVSATRGGRGQLSYAASKAGLEALVRVGAQEFSRVGVLVNGIAPGVIETDMSASVMEYVKSNQKENMLFDRIAMRRVGQPQEIASVISALSADEVTYLTGQVLRVDGGYML